MDLRSFFTSQVWWGKVICACLGYLLAGPIGAFFGIFIGNLFDRGLFQHYSNPMWAFHAEKNTPTRRIFFRALFSVLGHVAKADGRISQQEIQMAEQLMQNMHLNQEQRKKAQNFFNEGKQDSFNLESVLSSFSIAARNNPGLIRLFVNIQYEAAQLDGLSEQKIMVMNTILRHMRYAPIHEQSRFNEDFFQKAYQSNAHQHSKAHYQSSNHSTSTGNTVAEAYTILQITPNATKPEVKQAYRKLISRHHPDKLIAKGKSAAEIKLANEKTQIIRKAYEQICASKGW